MRYRRDPHWKRSPLHRLRVLVFLGVMLPGYARSADFTDVSVASGTADGGKSQGIAWGDYDNDGDLDLYVTKVNTPNRLFRNDDGGTFTEVGAASGTADAGYGQAAVWGDYDNDGDLDLYVANNTSASLLLRNNGNGTFTDVAASFGVTNARPSIGAAWADFDLDGDLDLFVANLNAENRLYRNDGGVFTDVAVALGANDGGPSAGVAWGDYDQDGDPDLYVTRVNETNRLLRNNGGGGGFTDVGPASGTGDAGYGIAAAWGDYDNDGDLDLYLANVNSANRLYRNDGGGMFTERGAASGTADPGNARGVAWGDYDNDGDLDLYLANIGSANRLYRNNNDGTFTDVGGASGTGNSGNGEGTAWADYDNDGDLDLYVANDNQPNKLYRNDVGTLNHWLQVSLVGVFSNRSGIGARVRVVVGGVSRIREIEGGMGLLSQNSLPVEFGLGVATVADSIVVRWPSGIIQVQSAVPTNQRITFTEQMPSLVPRKYPPGPSYRSCPDTLTVFDVQQTDTLLAPCHPATLDTVCGVRGIITAFDAIASSYGFYIQNTFATGAKPWTGTLVLTASTNYKNSVPGTPTGGNLALGDSVVVYGTTQEFPATDGETEIEGPDRIPSTNDIIIRKIVSGHPLPPAHVGTTAELNWMPAMSAATAEPWEGCLVRIDGPLRVARTQQGAGVGVASFLVVNPGAGSCLCDSILVEGITLVTPTITVPPAGTTLDFVQGILNQRTSSGGAGVVNSYRIQLRDADDMGLQTPPNLVDAYPIEDNLLRLVFDRNVDPASAQNAAHYSLGSQINGSTVNSATLETNPGKVVRLAITSVRTDGDLESVTVVGIGSATCPGCTISSPQSRSFVNGVLAITAIQQPDATRLPLFDDRSRFAGSGTAVGIRLSFRGISVHSYGSLSYLEDLAGGQRSGVMVFAPGPNLTAGHRYLIAGQVQEFSGETEVANTVYIVDEGTGAIPAPTLQTVHVLADTTTDMNGTHLTGEDFEGVLVRVDASIVLPFNTPPTDPSPGGSFRIGQPLDAPTDTILVSSVQAGKYSFDANPGMYVRVTGILGQSGMFRILPRGDADIQLLGAVGVDAAAPRSPSLSVAPNPARTARVSFTVSRRSPVNLAVFDLQGREVARLASGVFEPGDYTRDWNGMDSSGHRMGSGIYFYRFEVGNQVLNARGIIVN